MKAVQIAAKAQQDFEAQEIANLAQQTKPKDMEIPTKKAGIIMPPSDSDFMKIDLGNAILVRRRLSVPTFPRNRNSCSPTFLGTTKISLLRS
jgi:hypothetical protein